MIVLVARAAGEGPPVVTTPDTIAVKGEELSVIMAGLAERLLPVMERVTGVAPVEVSIVVTWQDGSEKSLDLGSPEFPGGKVPPHMS